MLKESVPVEAGEVIDATFMDTAALQAFLREQIARAKDEGVLFSLHLKATMMKVSDPIIFGHAVQAFFPKLFAEQGEVLLEAGLDPSNGLASILSGAEKLGGEKGKAIADAVEQGLEGRPRAGHGRRLEGHHQPARAERRDRGREHARDDPDLGPHVGPAR